MGLVNQGIYTRVWVQNMKIEVTKMRYRSPTKSRRSQLKKTLHKIQENQISSLSPTPSLKNKVHEGDFWGDKILGPGL